MENIKKTHIPFHRLFFYLTVLCVPIQLGLHFWPSWAMVLGRRVDYLSPTLYFTDILIALTLSFWIKDLCKRSMNYGLRIMGKTIIHNTSTLIPPLLFIIINIIFSKNIPNSLYQWGKIIEFGLFAYYIAKTKPKFERVVIPLSLGVLYSSCLAIVQFFLQRSIGGPLWILGERTFFADTPGIAQISLCDIGGTSCGLFLRPYATFPHPNVLAGFLAVTLPLFVYFLLNNTSISGSVKKILTVSTLIGMFALVLTFGRSAWMACGIGILMVMHFVLHQKKNTFYTRHAKIMVFGFVLLVFSGVFSVVGLVRDSESYIVRSELQSAALAMIRDNVFFGVGWGNFLTALPLYLTDRTIYFLQPVHNIYMLVISQLGVVGVMYFGICIMYYAKHVKNYFSIISLPMFLILLLGFVDHYFLTLQSGQLLTAIFVGMFLASTVGKKLSTT